MYSIVYRWQVVAGCEDLFVDSWSALTRAIREQCGSYGSRLHRSDNAEFVAYASWPDRATSLSCNVVAPEALKGMRTAVQHRYEPIRLDLVEDLLDAGPPAAHE